MLLVLATVVQQINYLPNVIFFSLLKQVIIFLNIFFTVETQKESAKSKAEKEERRILRQKKAHQKAKQQAGLASDSEDVFEPRANALVSKHFIFIAY
jgi:hypothetical protein